MGLGLTLGLGLVGCGSPSTVGTAPPSEARASPAVTTGAEPLRYVALGDSYTIGTSVAEADRWPNQLAARLPQLALAGNLGVNGFTSRDLIEVELPRVASLRPDVVSVLIGVNDVVQAVPSDAYRANVADILDELLETLPANRILMVTTPDYTVTPSGADYGDPAQQSAGIRENNAIITGLARARGIAVVDIYDLSLRAARDRTLVASDGLHPSGAQYALWVERIAPTAEALLAT